MVYRVKASFVATGSIGIFDKVRTWLEFWFDFGFSTLILLALGVALGFVTWSVSESWYR